MLTTWYQSISEIFLAASQPLWDGRGKSRHNDIATTTLSNEREKVIDQYLVIMQIGFVKSLPDFLHT